MADIGPFLQDGVNPRWIPKKNTSKPLNMRNAVFPAAEIYSTENLLNRSKSDDESMSQSNESNQKKNLFKRGFSASPPRRNNSVKRSLGRRASTCHFLNYDEGDYSSKSNVKKDCVDTGAAVEPAANENLTSTKEAKEEEKEKEGGGEEGLGIAIVNECKKQLLFASRIFVQDSDSTDMEMETLMVDDNAESGEPNDKRITNRGSISSADILHLTLHQCARDGDLTSIQLILDYLAKMKTLKRNINKHDETDLSPLHYAVRYGHMDIVKLLIKHGADIDNAGAYGAHPLHFAAKYKRDNVKKGTKTEEEGEEETEEQEEQEEEEEEAESEEVTQESAVKYLVESGANINCQDTYGCTPLHYASMRGSDSAVRDLLSFPQIEIDKVDKTMMTALHTAARYSQVVVAEELINADAKVQCFDDENCTPLFYACLYGCQELVKLLFDKTIEKHGWIMAHELLNDRNIDGKTCLHAAVDGGNTNIVRACLQRNADVNATQLDNSMPLHLAAMSGNMDCVQMLIEHNARIDAFDREQSTPLHKACLYNHHEVAKYLIEQGARVNKRDRDSYTPLLLAALRGHVETIEVLMEAFADHTAVDKSEKTAVYLAAEENHLEALKKLLENPIVNDQIHVSDQYGNVPLHIAAKEGYIEIVRLLLQNGANLMVANDEESSPIHLAAQHGRTNVVRLLVQEEKSVAKSEDEDSNTPLHIAAIYGHDMVGEVLIKYGADVCALNNKMWTPLDCAAANGMTSIAEILLDSDSPVDPADKTKMTPLHLAAQRGHSRMVSILLAHDANIGQCDSEGNNCLDMAIDNNHADVAMLLINHEKWEDVMRNETLDLQLGCRQTPMRKLIQKMPEVATRVLDRCVTSIGDSSSPDHCMTFCYEYLDDTYIDWKEGKSSEPTNSYTDEVNVSYKGLPYTTDMTLMKSNHPLFIMVDNKREELLSHPVVIQLLNYKWFSFGAVFYYLNFCIYAIFLSFFTGYILEANPPELNVIYYNGTYCDTENIVNPTFFPYYGRYVILVLSVFMMYREVFQFYQAGKGYLTFVNMFEWVTYILTFLFVLGFSKCQWQRNYIEQWQWNIGSIAIFFAWLDLVLFVQKFPRFGIYVVMVTDIFYTFIQFALVFLLFIVAFAFGFYALLQYRIDKFNNQILNAPFGNIGKSLIKTSVMFIGEFEFQDLFFDPDVKPQFEYMTYILFVIFLVFGSIIIMNLLVGLAVDDIKDVQRQATLKRRAMQVDLVLDVERILPFPIHRKKILKYQKVYSNAQRRFSFLKYFSVRTVKADDVQQILNPELDEIKSIQKKQKDLKRKMYELTHSVNEMRAQNRRMESMVLSIIRSQGITWQEEDYQDDSS